VSIGVQTGPTIGVQKGTTWRRCVGVDYGHGFCAGAGVGVPGMGTGLEVRVLCGVSW